jgi:hypothetical protein
MYRTSSLRGALCGALVLLLCCAGCGDDKGTNDQDDSYPVQEWTVVQPNTYQIGGLYDIVWSGAQFVATGELNQYPADTGIMLVSQDGLTWTEVEIEGSPSMTDVAYNGSLYLAIAQGVVYTSADGLAWVPFGGGSPGRVSVVEWLDTLWVASGYGPTVGLWTSPDGLSWTRRYRGFSEALTDFASNGTIIVGVGWGGQIMTSPNAVDWTPQSSPTHQILYGVVWDGTRFLAAGHNYNQGGVVISSTNGIDWQTLDSGSVGNIFGVGWSDRAYVVVGGVADSVATVAASYDGQHWTPQVCAGGTDLHDVAWNGTRFVAVGDGGLIVASTPLTAK